MPVAHGEAAAVSPQAFFAALLLDCFMLPVDEFPLHSVPLCFPVH